MYNSSQHGCLRICTNIEACVCVCVVPTQFGLTCPNCPSDGHNQLPALWYPGICHQARPIPPITQINAAQRRWIGIRVMADGGQQQTRCRSGIWIISRTCQSLPFQRGLWILHCFFVCRVCRDLGMRGNGREFQDDLETFYKTDCLAKSFFFKHLIIFVFALTL